jgi:phosphoribosyl 1,2-cyclic phosphodiesterase
MSIRLCVLGSGSGGNCTFIGSDRVAILVDAGLSAREITRRLGSIGVSADDITAVCVTHAHGDHTAGLRVLQKKTGADLWMSSGTRRVLSNRLGGAGSTWQRVRPGVPFTIGDLRIEAFPVPHDAPGTVGFVVRTGGESVGLMTDAGQPTALAEAKLRRCRAVVLEANHDVQMLLDSARPMALKERILGSGGHLSNDQAASVAVRLARGKVERLFLAHLSSACNDPDVARQVVRRALRKAKHRGIRITMTHQDAVSDVWRMP